VRIRSQEEQEKVIDGKEVDGVGVEEMVERSSGVMGWSGMVVAVGCRWARDRGDAPGYDGCSRFGLQIFGVFVLPGFGIWRKMLELHRKLELNYFS
jgi:hypothetical protein